VILHGPTETGFFILVLLPPSLPYLRNLARPAYADALMNENQAAREAFADLRITLRQLRLLQKMIDDCYWRFLHTKDSQKREAVQHEFTQLQSERASLYKTFKALNARIRTNLQTASRRN
jgi:hypothetical protein